MVFLRQIHQRVGFVRMPGCTTQVVTVPALGHILAGDGRGTVQHRGPEQASPQHFVLVNVDLQRFHSLSFLVSNNRYHNSRRKSTKTFYIIACPISGAGGKGLLRRRARPNSVRRTPSSAMESSPRREKSIYPSMVSMTSSSAPVRRSTCFPYSFDPLLSAAEKSPFPVPAGQGYVPDDRYKSLLGGVLC